MRLMAFDPSLRNLGVSTGNIIDGQLHVDYGETFYIDKLVDKYSDQPEWDIDPNTRRCILLESVVETMVASHRPDILIIELPIYNSLNPKSLQVQMKAITILEMVALKVNPHLKANIVEYMPNVIKLGVGIDVAKKDMGDKLLITKALKRCEAEGTLVYTKEEYRPDVLDEHANDSVAMLYTKYKELQDEFSK